MHDDSFLSDSDLIVKNFIMWVKKILQYMSILSSMILKNFRKIPLLHL